MRPRGSWNASSDASCCVLSVLLPVHASAKWTQLKSENFTFIGDAPEGQIRRVAERLEQFRDALLRVLPGANAQSPVPTVVLVFDQDRTMTPVKPLFRGNPIELAGYFQSGEDVNYIAVNAEFLDLAVLAIFHEYAHFLVSNSQGSVPIWVGEGLAELYEITQQLDGGKSVVIGRAPAHHVELLKASTMMPIKELVAVGRDASVYNEGNRRSVLYAQSWALVHYLTLGSPVRAPQFRKYLGRCGRGPPRQTPSRKCLAPTWPRSTASCSTTCGSSRSPPSASTSLRSRRRRRSRAVSRSRMHRPTPIWPICRRGRDAWTRRERALPRC